MSTTTQAQLKKKGLILTASFFVILVIIFMPIFPGTGESRVNGLDYLDNFFNELSKGSANYIDEQRQRAEPWKGKELSATMKFKSEDFAATVVSVFTAHAIPVEQNGMEVKVNSKDFGQMLMLILNDAEAMYDNKKDELQAKYNMDGQKAFYAWYLAMSAMEKDLTLNSKFDEAKALKVCMSKAVEPAYNYYGVQSKSVKAEIFLLVAALVFYVVYTMWYGFGLLYLFEGMGIKLEH